MTRWISVWLLTLIFATGATCAAVCPERTADSGHDEAGGACTECMSTHFVPAAKSADTPPADLQDIVDPPLAADADPDSPAIVLSTLSGAASPGLYLSATTVLRI